jgi:hypothetical protein
MEKHNLLDLAPKKISHTWSNGRKGEGLVAKRLDRHLISKVLIEIGVIYDHMPIVLEVSKVCLKMTIPLKFNHE